MLHQDFISILQQIIAQLVLLDARHALVIQIHVRPVTPLKVIHSIQQVMLVSNAQEIARTVQLVVQENVTLVVLTIFSNGIILLVNLILQVAL